LPCNYGLLDATKLNSFYRGKQAGNELNFRNRMIKEMNFKGLQAVDRAAFNAFNEDSGY
jgi:hypothetical protein